MRKLLIKGDTTKIQSVIDLHLIPVLLQYTQQTEHPQLQLDAAWCIANLSSGSYTQLTSLLKRGLLDILPRILNSPHEKIYEQAIWTIGNLAADDEIINNIMDNELDEIVIEKLWIVQTKPAFESTAWALCNIARKLPKKTDPSKKGRIFTNLIKLMMLGEGEFIILDALSGIQSTIDSPLIRIHFKVEILARLVALGKASTSQRIKSLIISIYQHLSYEDCLASEIAKSGAFDIFFNWLSDPESPTSLQEDILMAVSNFSMDSEFVNSRLIDSQEKLDLIFRLANSENEGVCREAIFCLCNMTAKSSRDKILHLIKSGLLFVCQRGLLSSPEKDLILVILEALKNTAKAFIVSMGVGETVVDITLEFERCGLVDSLEYMLRHDDKAVYEITYSLMDKYLDCEC